MALSHRIGSRRWEIGLVATILVVAAMGRCLLYPAAIHLWAETDGLRQDVAFVGRAASLSGQMVAAEGDAKALEDILKGLESRQAFNEAVVLERVYRLSDSAGCQAGKVEIGTPVVVEGGREIPILFNGSGTYEAIGTLLDGIENMGYTSRVRQVTMKRAGAGVTLFLDFVVLDD